MALSALLCLLFSINVLFAQTNQYTSTLEGNESKAVEFGICTDVHNDIIYNPESRLRTFVDDMKEKEADFIIQLGDFCYPDDNSNTFIAIFEEFGENAYSVIGNHDRDNGASLEKVIEFYSMPAAYYSFDKNNIHFIVMDGNEEKIGDSLSTISDAQIVWLIKDLNSTDKKTVVFIHESFTYDDISNAEVIRNIFSSHLIQDGSKKVLACFNGHKHTDELEKVDGVWYVTINSMSYMWVGEEYGHKIEGVSESIYNQKPELKYTCPYKDPLYAFVTIFENGTIAIKGQTSTWVDPSPMELEFDGGVLPPEKRPVISDTILN